MPHKVRTRSHVPVLTLSLWTHCPSRREALYRAPAYLAGLKKDRWIAFEDLYKLEIKKNSRNCHTREGEESRWRKSFGEVRKSRRIGAQGSIPGPAFRAALRGRPHSRPCRIFSTKHTPQSCCPRTAYLPTHSRHECKEARGKVSHSPLTQNLQWKNFST